MSNLTFLRWKRGEPRRGRPFPALQLGHPSYDTACVLCNYSLGSDLGGVTLVAVGPSDEEDREHHNAGRWYSAMAVLVHTTCSEHINDLDLELVVAELVVADPPAPGQ